MTPTIGSALDGVSALAIGAYLGAVIFNGNANAFISEAVKDYSYLEFVIALAIVRAVASNKTLQPLVYALIATAVFAALLQFVRNDSSVVGKLEDFSSGRKGLFETIFSIGQ